MSNAMMRSGRERDYDGEFGGVDWEIFGVFAEEGDFQGNTCSGSFL